MLPPAFAADIVPAPEQARLRPRFPNAQAIVRIRLGACACLLRLARNGEDERHLRRRYAALGLSRDRIIAALERHRRSEVPRADPAACRAALAGFVVEHGRNAGPTLYYFGFGAEPADGLITSAPALELTVAAVRAAPDSWLAEGTLTEVIR